MKLNKESRRLSKDLFRASFTDGRLDENKVRGFVQQIVAGKPRHYVDILKSYQRQIRLEVEKRHATIESATELDHGAGERVLHDLRAKYGHDITATFSVNPALIGGLRIRIGDDVFDGSVQGRLARLEQELATA